MFEELKEYAIEYKVPIIKDEGLEFLLSSIKNYNVKSCLEIGTAIAYSALNMASLGLSVTTIERNEEMYKKAQENVKKYPFGSNIELVFSDALEYTPLKEYDLIFIDAAKAQNIKFFERFTPFLKKGGIVVVDNLNFHGLTEKTEGLSKNLRSLVRKINEFKVYLKDRFDYDTTFTDQGDGMSLSIKL